MRLLIDLDKLDSVVSDELHNFLKDKSISYSHQKETPGLEAPYESTEEELWEEFIASEDLDLEWVPTSDLAMSLLNQLLSEGVLGSIDPNATGDFVKIVMSKDVYLSIIQMQLESDRS